MRLFTLILLLFSITLFGQDQQKITKPIDLIVKSQNEGQTFRSAAPLQVITGRSATVTELEGTQTPYDLFNLDQSKLKALSEDQPETMTFQIPSANRSAPLELQLVRVELFSSDFQVALASDRSAAEVDRGIHYRGIINGDPSSVVSMSIFNDEIMGLIANDRGNLVLGKLKGEEWDNKYILYSDREILNQIPFECGTQDDGVGYKKKDLEFDETNRDIGD